MASRPEPTARGELLLRRTFKILLAVALLIVLAFLGAAFLPRWWAQRVGNQVNGGMILGIILGLFYGFVFTVVPALTARFAFHTRRPPRTRAPGSSVARTRRSGRSAGPEVSD